MKELKISARMRKGIERIIKPWTTSIEECDGRNLGGVAITLKFENEECKEFHPAFWDFCTITVQDVRWNGETNRHERDIYTVRHDGEMCKF